MEFFFIKNKVCLPIDRCIRKVVILLPLFLVEKRVHEFRTKVGPSESVRPSVHACGVCSFVRFHVIVSSP